MRNVTFLPSGQTAESSSKETEMPATAAQTWLKAKPAADRLGVTVYTLHNMALSGLVRFRSEPGALPRFHAEDIDKLREKAAHA